jgi:hypothetical protein
MPPFYIGKSSVKKVMNGYNGSVTSRLYTRNLGKMKGKKIRIFSRQ